MKGDISSTSSSSSTPSTSRDVPQGHRPPLRTGTEVNHGTSPENLFWRKKNLLSLDGGGIRGIWTLHVLEKLEQYIYYEEVKQAKAAGEDDRDYHSFWPEKYPKHVSQLQDERNGDENQVGIPIRRAILLCHYFDYMGGTSTGSLIVIMLGRFRMTAHDCLHEYKQMSHRIFRKPRLISQPNLGVSRPKYKARDLEAALKQVTLGRCDKSTAGGRQTVKPLLPMTRGTCQIFVTTIRKTTMANGIISEADFLIRSYNHHAEPHPSPPRRQNTNSKAPTQPINHGPAEEIEVARAARAATAAPMYFEEATFPQWVGKDGQQYSFIDAGVTPLNNPTGIGLQEIETLRGGHTVGAVVNIGTSRKEVDPSKKSFKNRMKRLAGSGTNPKIVAGEIDRRRLDHYWRFNDDDGIDLDLDHCKPNHWWTKDEHRGTKTFEKLEHEFHRWLSDRENTTALEECARNLVEIRRGRSKERSQWEQFALATHDYSCTHSTCDQSGFNNRNLFELHWRASHSPEPVGEPHFRSWEYQGASKRPKL